MRREGVGNVKVAKGCMRINPAPRVRAGYAAPPTFRPAVLMRHRCRRHDESTANQIIESATPQCGESQHHGIGCRGLRRRRAGHSTQAGCVCRVSEGPDLRGRPTSLSSPSGVRLDHTSLLFRTADAAVSALEQGPGPRRALGGGVQCSWARVAPVSQHAPEGGTRADKGSRLVAWPDSTAGDLCQTPRSEPQCTSGRSSVAVHAPVRGLARAGGTRWQKKMRVAGLICLVDV